LPNKFRNSKQTEKHITISISILWKKRGERRKSVKQKDTYAEPITYIYPNAVVRVYHPILTPEERERRMKQIAKSAADLLRK
jgi:hypothetical protein